MQLLHADCRDVLLTLDPTRIALVLTDPPYGIDVKLRNHCLDRAKRNIRIQGDHDQSLGQHVLDWAAHHHLPTVAFASPMHPWEGKWRQHLVWHKGPAVGGLGDLKRTWKQSWELIQVARNSALRLKRDQSVLNYPITPIDLKQHPTAKPVALLAYLIEQLTDPGDTVFDPFMGSGSTAVACQQTGRTFIGMEIDPKYFAIAILRTKLNSASMT